MYAWLWRRLPGGALEKAGLALAAVVVVAVLPSFVSGFRAQQFAYVAIYLTALIVLNILTGYTGQISLGHWAFMAIGGYTTAILMVDHGVKDIWTIPVAAVVTGVVGFLFGIPALRLSGLYLALATFAVRVWSSAAPRHHRPLFDDLPSSRPPSRTAATRVPIASTEEVG